MKSRFLVLDTFLDFAYTDIGKLTRPELDEVAVNVYWLGLGSAAPEDPFMKAVHATFASIHENDLKEILNNIVQIQEFLRDKVKLVFYQVQALKKETDDIQKTYKGGSIPDDHPAHPLNQTVLSSIEATASITCYIDEAEDPDDENLQHAYEERKITTNLSLRNNRLKNLEYQLYQSMNGIQLKALRQCEECKRIFVHTSKQPRRFCENKCAAKQRMRKKRAELKKEKED